jgi:hypothetical protein
MGESLKVPALESAGSDLRPWIRRLVVAVIVGQAIWSLLVSIIHNLVVPALARVMGGDPQSPLYLGKGDFNIPALLISVLEACLAGIVAALLYSWSEKSSGTRIRVVRVAPQKSLSVMPTPAAAPANIPPPSAPPPSPPPLSPTLGTADKPSPAPVPEIPSSAPPRPAQSAPQAPPAKPKKPKKVYYNTVGDPIEDDDE